VQHLDSYLKSVKRPLFVVFLMTSSVIVAIIFNYLFGLIVEKDIIWLRFPSEEKNILLRIIAGIIIAPLLETILFQTLPYVLLNKVRYFSGRDNLIIIISAVFFGLNHFYSLFYIIYAILIGLIFTYFYVVRIKDDKKTFYLIALCHSLFNLIGILISVI
jgi:uncharacterized protein